MPLNDLPVGYVPTVRFIAIYTFTRKVSSCMDVVNHSDWQVSPYISHASPHASPLSCPRLRCVWLDPAGRLRPPIASTSLAAQEMSNRRE
jgi:hypothetical protein